MNLSPGGGNPLPGGALRIELLIQFHFNSIELNGVLYIYNMSRPQVGPKSSRSILYTETSSQKRLD